MNIKDTEAELYQEIEQDALLEQKKLVRKSDTLFLFITAISGSMLMIVLGTNLVWTSSVIPKLTSNKTEDNPIGRVATSSDIFKIVGIPNMGKICGPLLFGSLPERIGRKRSLQLLGAGVFLSYVVLAYSNSIWLISTSRYFASLTLGGYLTIFPVYLTEICEDHNRARYGCLMHTGFPIGSLFGYAMGSFLNIRNYTLALASPLVLYMIFFIFSPESPVYLLSKRKHTECVRALKKLRSDKNDKEIASDLDRIEEAIKGKPVASRNNVFSIFSTKEQRYSFLLALVPALTQFSSGITIILPYMGPIFVASGIKYNYNFMSTIVGLTELCSSLFTSLIIEKTGRKPMLLISSVGTSVSLLVLGLFFYLKHIQSHFITHFQLVPLICLMGVIIFYSLGLGIIPLAIAGEFFTSDTRSVGMSLLVSLMGILIFATTSIYPFFVDALGMHWCIWTYSVTCALGASFILFLIPETKGKSIVEIQEYVKNRCNK